MWRLGHLLTGLVLTLALFDVQAQSVIVNGRVVDAKTNVSIPFVNIGVLNGRYGTSSNEDGEFELKADSLPIELIFSHLNYERRGIVVSDNSEILIKLVPVPQVLDVITVRGKKRKGYIEKLVSKVYNKAVRANDIQYGKAFYRQKSQNDSLYSELYEIFYDAKFSNKGLLEWEVQEGRYAINLNNVNKNQLVNKNFTLLSRLLTTVLPPTDDVIMPINPNVKENYSYEIKEVIKSGGRELVVLDFVPLNYLNAPKFEGEVVVDINSYEVLRVKGRIADDRLKFLKLTREGFWKNYVLDYEIAFKESDSNLQLDYIRIDQAFDYFVDNQFQFPVKTNAWLTFYEYYTPKRRKRLGGGLRFRKSDAAILDQLGYSQDFWEENPIVKRTPVEEEVIKAFESQEAFGTIYLNNQKQIVLEKKDLMKDPFINELRFNFTNTSKKQEKVYLHLDKPFYTAGEDLWYSVYLVDGSSHKTNAESGVVYVELINPDDEIVEHQAIRMEDGQGRGEIRIQKDWVTGKYRMRAYTNWMLNFDPSFFFDQELAIYNSLAEVPSEAPENLDYSLRFYPEGGDIMADMVNRVAYKAVDQNGKGIDVKGEIFNSENKAVARFDTKNLGMGSIYFKPHAGEKYFALVKYNGTEKRIPLPDAKSSGYRISANNQKSNTIILTVEASETYHEENFYIIGQSRGRIYYESKEVITKNGVVVEIPKIRLPDGVFQITLFDHEGNPHCERLVFIDHEQDPEIEVFPNREDFGARDEVELKIRLTDLDGSPVAGKFSLAVTDGEQVVKNEKEGNILSNLLLSSDIKGTIEQPGSYFQNRDKTSISNLDLLMLTQGWRRFAWSSVMENKAPPIKKFVEKRGLTVTGVAVDPSDKTPLTDTDITALFISKSQPLSGFVKTDRIGKFQLAELNFLDTATIFFSRPGKKRGGSNLAVLVNDRQPVSVQGEPTRRTFRELTADQNVESYLEKR